MVKEKVQLMSPHQNQQLQQTRSVLSILVSNQTLVFADLNKFVPKTSVIVIKRLKVALNPLHSKENPFVFVERVPRENVSVQSANALFLHTNQ
jgi:hypothetical protein